jgi:hypothetical protein
MVLIDAKGLLSHREDDPLERLAQILRAVLRHEPRARHQADLNGRASIPHLPSRCNSCRRQSTAWREDLPP